MLIQICYEVKTEKIFVGNKNKPWKVYIQQMKTDMPA